MDVPALNVEDRYRRLVEDLRLIVWEFDRTTKRFVYVSPQAQAILGYSLEQWHEPQFWYHHVHPDDREEALRFSHEHVARGEDHAFEYRMLRSDGEPVWFRDITSLMQRDGAVVALHGVLIDITERKQAEQALRANEERLREVFESAVDPLWDWDIVRDTTTFSPSWPRLLGYEPAEFQREQPTWEMLVHPDDMARVKEVLDQCLRDECPQYEAEYRLITRDGSSKWVLSRGRVIARNTRGEPLRMVGSISDTTARVRAEEALRQSEHRFRSMAEASVVGIWQTSPEGRTLYINPSMCRMLGVDNAQSMHGRTFFEFFPGESLKVIETHLVKRRQGLASSYEVDLTPLRGPVRRVIIAGSPVTGPDGRIESIIGTFTDITERLAAESALRHSESRLRAIIDNTPNVAIQGYDRDGRVQFWNRATERMFGWSEVEARGRTLDELMLSPEDASEFVRTLREMERTGQSSTPGEWAFTSRCGRAGWCYSTMFMIADRTSSDPATGPEPKPVFICMDVEITERKRAEQAVAHSSQVHRLLLRELDHRVRNNLAALIGLIDLSARDSRGVPEFAASVRDRVQAMSTVHALLSRDRWRAVDLRDLLLNLMPSARPEMLTIDGPRVEVAARQATALGMVLQELFANSLKHGALGSPNGTVQVRWTVDDSISLTTAVTDAASIALPTRVLRLDWREQGGRPIDKPVTPSIGSRLIHGLVRAELAGEAMLTFPRDGAQHTLTLRLDPHDQVSDQGVGSVPTGVHVPLRSSSE
jgi:PAS domain S-box-containing protein